MAVRATAVNSFEGSLTPVPLGRAFGGQVLAQSLSAGAATAPDYPWPTSLHAYFVRPAASGLPATYDVEVTRDGGRFAWRRVRAIQDGAVLLDAMMCFQRHPMPDVVVERPRGMTDPESLPSPAQMIAEAGPTLSWFFERHGDLAVEGRYPIVAPPMRVAAGDTAPQQDVWLRGAVSGALSPAERGAVLTFLSDVNLIATPLIVLGGTGLAQDTRGASFDHSIQFSSSAPDVSGWLFYEQTTESVLSHSITTSGRIMSAGAVVLAMVRQQGLIV